MPNLLLRRMYYVELHITLIPHKIEILTLKSPYKTHNKLAKRTHLSYYTTHDYTYKMKTMIGLCILCMFVVMSDATSRHSTGLNSVSYLLPDVGGRGGGPNNLLSSDIYSVLTTGIGRLIKGLESGAVPQTHLFQNK